MTEFRRQIEQARNAHQFAQYPGRLSDRVLPRADRTLELAPSRRWLHRVVSALMGTSAVAAGIALLVMAGQPARTPPRPADEAGSAFAFEAVDLPTISQDSLARAIGDKIGQWVENPPSQPQVLTQLSLLVVRGPVLGAVSGPAEP